MSDGTRMELFMDFARRHDIIIEEVVDAALGKTWNSAHCAVKMAAGRRGKSAWYTYTDTPTMAFAVLGCWVCNTKVKWNSRRGRRLTQEEKALLDAREAEIKAQAEAMHEEQSAYLQEHWDELPELPEDIEHPYLQRKGVTCVGLKGVQVKGDPGAIDLMVPMRDAQDKMWSYQLLLHHPYRNREGKILTKMNMREGRTKGLFHAMGPWREASQIVLAEGYASAWSARAITEYPACCCFGTGNVPAVFAEIRKAYPKKLILLWMDEDGAGMGAAAKLRLCTGVVQMDNSLFNI